MDSQFKAVNKDVFIDIEKAIESIIEGKETTYLSGETIIHFKAKNDVTDYEKQLIRSAILRHSQTN